MSAERTLAETLCDLDEDAVGTMVEEALAAGKDPLALLDELQAGMERVGKRFGDGEYFLSELIFAAEIFKKAIASLGNRLKSTDKETVGTMVIGTAKGDIHDFGKDIVATILSCNGIKVVDLGVNVEYQAFVDAIREHKPQFVGISCLLTTVFENMKATIDAIGAAGLRDQVKVLIGGGPTDQSVADYVGADLHCANAQSAVEATRKLLGRN
jgi:methanogenic corrinoid protein MtbC1